MRLQHLLSLLKDKLPCDYYAVHALNTSTIHSNYPPEWVNFYTQNKYEKMDPALFESQKNLLPFYWDENVARSLHKKKKDIFRHAKNFNIYCGISIMNAHFNSVLTLSSQDKFLQLPEYDYLCTSLSFLNYFSLLPESSPALSDSDIISLFNKFKKAREKISTTYHTPLFQALHHLQMSRISLGKTIFSSEKESAMKDLSQTAHLIDCFIEKIFTMMNDT